MNSMDTERATVESTAQHGSLSSLLFSLLTSPYVVGLALMRAWTFIVFFSSIPLAPYVPSHLMPTQQVFSNVYIISFSLFITTAILCGILPRQATAFLSHPLGAITGPLLACLGTLQYLLPGMGEAHPLIFALPCAASTGIGSSLILLQLSRHCHTARYRMVARETTAAFSLGALLSILAFLIPPALALALCAVLPLPCGFLALQRSDAPSRATAKRPLRHDRRVLIKFAISAAAFGVAVGLARDLYTFSDSFQFTASQSLLHAVLMAGIMLAVLAVIVRKTRFGPLVLYRIILILIGIGLLALLFFGVNSFLPGILVSVGYMIFELLIWITFAHLSQRLDLSPLKLFGLWRGVLLGCGPFLGGLVVNLCGNYAPQVFAGTGVFLFVALGFLIIAYSLIFNERDLTLLYPHSVGETYATTSIQTADAMMPNSAPDTPDNDTRQDPNLVVAKTRYEQIAKHFELSARETEVMTLMALGRSSTRIQKELFISAGTVNSHRLHIYQKLNVHSLQELLDVLDASY
jgi:DNA-binding CsgD family transcriptional regulator